MSQSEQTPLVSAILVCHNDGKWLPRCLESLRAQTIADRLEVIIADNASTDGSDKLAQDLIAGRPNERFSPTGGGKGYGGGCNHGALEATGKYLYLLNPDVWLEPDCAEKLVSALERTGIAAASGTALNYEDDTVQTEPGTGFDFTGNAVATNPQAERLMCPAQFFFVRREAYIRVGMMDPKWYLYWEEMDLSWRLWIAGEKMMRVRDARVHHFGAVNVNPEGGKEPSVYRTSVQKRFYTNRNNLLFIAKDCQHVLLLMLLPTMVVILLEGLVTLGLTRNWVQARAVSTKALGAAWELLPHIREQRRQIASFRRHGDFWMLRFFRLGFARWRDAARIFKTGFPKLS